MSFQVKHHNLSLGCSILQMLLVSFFHVSLLYLAVRMSILYQGYDLEVNITYPLLPK